MMTEAEGNQNRTEALKDRLFTELNAGMSCLSLYLGYRLGLFAAMAQAGPVTPQELAQRTGYAQRYVREWLSCMAAGGYLDYQPEAGRFVLPPEHLPVFLEPDHPAYALGVLGWIPSLGSVLPQLMEAFRSGGGVPYEAYGQDMVEAQALSTRSMFANDYAKKWISAMPDVERRLRVGGRVVEVGCGAGWSSTALARAFPKAHIDAVDPDTMSIEEARRNAIAAGVSEHITFHQATIEEAMLQGPYDLVSAFECLHDMAHPVSALCRMRELAAPDGAVLIADEAVGDSLQENRNFLGHLFYNFSVLHCLPQAMTYPDSAATGTVMGPSTVRRYAQEAGFSRVHVLPVENPSFRFYRLTP